MVATPMSPDSVLAQAIWLYSCCVSSSPVSFLVLVAWPCDDGHRRQVGNEDCYRQRAYKASSIGSTSVFVLAIIVFVQTLAKFMATSHHYAPFFSRGCSLRADRDLLTGLSLDASHQCPPSLLSCFSVYSVLLTPRAQLRAHQQLLYMRACSTEPTVFSC
jgi:hypothetical protein